MSCWNVGACGAITVPAFVFLQCGFSVGRFVGVANSCIYVSGFG